MQVEFHILSIVLILIALYFIARGKEKSDFTKDGEITLEYIGTKWINNIPATVPPNCIWIPYEIQAGIVISYDWFAPYDFALYRHNEAIKRGGIVTLVWTGGEISARERDNATYQSLPRNVVWVKEGTELFTDHPVIFLKVMEFKIPSVQVESSGEIQD